MLYATSSAAEKRARFREVLAGDRLLCFVGAYQPLIALMIEKIGFDGIYLGSSTVSANLGLPDIGLITQTEVVSQSQATARLTHLPTLVDCDTGFGEAVNAARTIQALEDAGVAAMHIEDQMNPKRCGHLDNKQLIGVSQMAERIAAAAAARRDPNFLIMARTDARAEEGLDGALARAEAYIAAGADAIFPEALQDESEFREFRRAVRVPLLANMTEFGKSPLLPRDTLQEIGFDMAIYPATALRLAMKAVEDGLRQLHREGTQTGLLQQMQTRAQLYDLIDYEGYGAFDTAIADIGPDGKRGNNS